RPRAIGLQEGGRPARHAQSRQDGCLGEPRVRLRGGTDLDLRWTEDGERCLMRVLVIHAHPVETSFNRAIFHTAVEALKDAGHEVDPLNLYEENFEAVMSREERLAYHDVPENVTPAIKPYVDRLLAAEGVVIIHPVWNYGYPAILKGFFDRIFITGVSFVLENGNLR